MKNLPEGLGGTYKRILTKISETPTRARLAHKIFQWATIAERPLHITELKEAVAIEPSDIYWDKDKFSHDDIMLASCRGLIVNDEDDGTVHFAHHTVRQYLIGGLTTKVDPRFEVLVGDAHILAGQTCVAYLSFSDFETQITSSTPIARLEQRGVLESGGPLWIPSVLGIRKPLFDIPYKLLRGDLAIRHPGSDYLKHLRPQPKAIYTPSNDLKEKYRLLSYAIDHWEPHSRWFTDAYSPRRFGNLIKYKNLAFEFRPWGANEHFGPYGCVGCPSSSAESLVAKDLPLTSMIHYAAEVGNLTLLKYVQSYGASLRDHLYHERHHQETLLIACRYNRAAVMQYLLINGNFDISDGEAVNSAADAGHVEVLQCLLRYGEYPIKEKGHIPLRLAAQKGHEAAVEAILEAGADPNAYDKQTILKMIESAAMNGQYLVVRILSQIRAWHNLIPTIIDYNPTILHLTAMHGHVATTRALLECGFPIDSLNSDRRNALHSAALWGHSTVVELLLQKGAAFLLDEYGMSPIDLAVKGGYINVLESFKTLSPTSFLPKDMSYARPLHTAVEGYNDEGIRWLVNNGYNIEAVDQYSETPLLKALRGWNEPAVRMLLELGASINPYHERCYSSNLSPAIDACLAKSSSIPILRMFFDKIRGDRGPSHAKKRELIVLAVENARKRKNIEAVKLLEDELTLYPE